MGRGAGGGEGGEGEGEGAGAAAGGALRLLGDSERLSCHEAFAAQERGEPHLLLDVRPERAFRMAALRNSVNVPLADLEARMGEVRRLVAPGEPGASARPVIVVCRRGNDSQRAVQALRAAGVAARDLRGGLYAWKREVDLTFPAC